LSQELQKVLKSPEVTAKLAELGSRDVSGTSDQAARFMTTRLAVSAGLKIVDRVCCLTTPGETIDAVVTEAGVALNLRRTDLHDRFRSAGINVSASRCCRHGRGPHRPQRPRASHQIVTLGSSAWSNTATGDRCHLPGRQQLVTSWQLGHLWLPKAAELSSIPAPTDLSLVGRNPALLQRSIRRDLSKVRKPPFAIVSSWPRLTETNGCCQDVHLEGQLTAFESRLAACRGRPVPAVRARQQRTLAAFLYWQVMKRWSPPLQSAASAWMMGQVLVLCGESHWRISFVSALRIAVRSAILLSMTCSL
jgi:hypothetical protein